MPPCISTCQPINYQNLFLNIINHLALKVCILPRNNCLVHHCVLDLWWSAGINFKNWRWWMRRWWGRRRWWGSLTHFPRSSQWGAGQGGERREGGRKGWERSTFFPFSFFFLGNFQPLTSAKKKVELTVDILSTLWLSSSFFLSWLPLNQLAGGGWHSLQGNSFPSIGHQFFYGYNISLTPHTTLTRLKRAFHPDSPLSFALFISFQTSHLGVD